MLCPVVAPAPVLLPAVGAIVSLAPAAAPNHPAAPFASMGVPGLTSGVAPPAGTVLQVPLQRPTALPESIRTTLLMGVLPKEGVALVVQKTPQSEFGLPPVRASLLNGFSPPAQLTVARPVSVPSLPPFPAISLTAGKSPTAEGVALVVQAPPKSEFGLPPVRANLLQGANLPASGTTLFAVRPPPLSSLPAPVASFLPGDGLLPPSAFTVPVVPAPVEPESPRARLYPGAPQQPYIFAIPGLDPYFAPKLGIGPIGPPPPGAATVSAVTAPQAPTWLTATLYAGSSSLPPSGRVLAPVGPFAVPSAPPSSLAAGAAPLAPPLMLVLGQQGVPAVSRGTILAGGMPPAGSALYVTIPHSAQLPRGAALAAGVLPPSSSVLSIRPPSSVPRVEAGALISPQAPAAAPLLSVPERSPWALPPGLGLFYGVVPLGNAKPIVTPAAYGAALPASPRFSAGYAVPAPAGSILTLPLVTLPYPIATTVALSFPGFGQPVVYIQLPSSPILWPTLTNSDIA